MRHLSPTPQLACMPAAEPDLAEVLRLDLNERHEQWLREQYLRDLETLGRIEHQRECFFDGMSGIHRQRGGNGT